MLRSLLTITAALISLASAVTPACAQYYPSPFPLQPVPNHPVIITAPTVQSVTPWGGYNTGNQVIQNSVFAPGRIQSLQNGSAQQIQRPVFNQQGQVIGYQQGLAWQNSLTGQWHHQIQSVTPNGVGGAHTEISVGESEDETPRRGRR